MSRGRNARDDSTSAVLGRALISLSDMHDARGALDCIEYLHPPQELQREYAARFLKMASVISYCRPFLASRGASAAFLRLEDLGLELPSPYAELHAEMLDLRSRAFAHSDESLRWASLVDVAGAGIGISGRTTWPYLDALPTPKMLALINAVQEALLQLIHRDGTPESLRK